MRSRSPRRTTRARTGNTVRTTTPPPSPTTRVPERAVATSGKLSLTPGVEQAVPVGDGALLATWLAVPVPSAAFDAFLEAEQARRPGVTPI